jgi:hypothetical protein
MPSDFKSNVKESLVVLHSLLCGLFALISPLSYFLDQPYHLPDYPNRRFQYQSFRGFKCELRLFSDCLMWTNDTHTLANHVKGFIKHRSFSLWRIRQLKDILKRDQISSDWKSIQTNLEKALSQSFRDHCENVASDL